tara:strand:+ start:722 stop:1912 length:1191 start_codon:yes stop_codon:yes gene_type:complete
MTTTILLEIANDPYIVKGSGFLAAAAVGAAGGLIKGIGSLFGRKRKRRAAARAEKAKAAAMAKVDAFKFKNAFEGMKGAEYDPVSMKAAQIGAAQTAQMPTLGESQGYEATGYSSQGYTAKGTNVGPLLEGDATGLTNEFNNLQVSTAGAELAAQEADQSLAASQDLAAQAGTGAGGATALAAAAAKSKSKVAADIDQQVKANEMRKAQGEMQLQRDQLGQSNLASQFSLGQQQFNAGQANQASQFTAAAANQASQFNANAANQAAQFGAQAANQFALTTFGAEAQMNQFNAGAQNQFTMQQAQLQQEADRANMAASNQAAQFGATTDFQARQLAAGGAERVQGAQYNRLAAKLGMASQEAGAKSRAYEKQRGMFLEGMTQAATGAASTLSSGGYL